MLTSATLRYYVLYANPSRNGLYSLLRPKAQITDIGQMLCVSLNPSAAIAGEVAWKVTGQHDAAKMQQLDTCGEILEEACFVGRISGGTTSQGFCCSQMAACEKAM
jgi:hypothetical protein